MGSGLVGHNWFVCRLRLCLLQKIYIFNLRGWRPEKEKTAIGEGGGGGGGGGRRLFEGGDLIEGRLLFDEIRYVMTALQRLQTRTRS